MTLVDGIFKYGETVAVEIDGKLLKRKVHYKDGVLFISVDGKTYTSNQFSGEGTFDKSAYILNYLNTKRDRISVLAPLGTKDVWKAYAADQGMSMNAFIISCVEKEIHGED